MSRRFDVESSLCFPSSCVPCGDLQQRVLQPGEESGCPCHSRRQQGLAVALWLHRARGRWRSAGAASAARWPRPVVWGGRCGERPARSPPTEPRAADVSGPGRRFGRPGFVLLRSPSVSRQRALSGVECKASFSLGGVIIKMPRIPAENEAHTRSRGKEPGSC